MKVILKKDVDNLGFSGDLKNVKNGYARNYLIPNDLVVSANTRTKKEYQFLKQMQERKIAKKRKEAEDLASRLEAQSFSVTVKMGKEGKIFGSVTGVHIHKAIQEKGFEIQKKMIMLNNPIKSLGNFKISVHIYEGIIKQISLTVQDENGNTVMPIIEKKEPEPSINEETVSSNESTMENATTENISNDTTETEVPVPAVDETPNT